MGRFLNGTRLKLGRRMENQKVRHCDNAGRAVERHPPTYQKYGAVLPFFFRAASLAAQNLHGRERSTAKIGMRPEPVTSFRWASSTKTRSSGKGRYSSCLVSELFLLRLLRLAAATCFPIVVVTIRIFRAKPGYWVVFGVSQRPYQFLGCPMRGLHPLRCWSKLSANRVAGVTQQTEGLNVLLVTFG